MANGRSHDGMNREPGPSEQAGMPSEFVDQDPNLPGDEDEPTVSEKGRQADAEAEAGEAQDQDVPPSPS